MLKRARTLTIGAIALCACASSADAATITFTNSAAISIPNFGVATPYPSTINVTGFTGDLTVLTLTLTGLTHTYPSDLDMLLVGPTGAALVFMSEAGLGGALSSVTLAFSDAAGSPLPAGPIASGTYRPADYVGSVSDSYPAPAPATFTSAGPSGSGTFASTFGGLDPNGVWRLFVVDNGAFDSGSLAGWSLTITAPMETGTSPVPEPTTFVLLGTGLAGMAGRRWRQRKRA